MENENENVIVNRNRNTERCQKTKIQPPTNEGKSIQYFKEICYSEESATHAFDYYTDLRNA